MWGQPCLAYNLQARLPASAIRALVEAQSSLRQLSVPLHTIPTAALHVSVYAMVPVSWPDPPKEPFWREIQPSVREIVKQVESEFRLVELLFHSLRILPLAVIALAEDQTGIFGSVRDRLKGAVRHPALSGPSYNQIHCTLGRFSASGSIAAGEAAACAARWRAFSTPIADLTVVREKRYPSLEVDHLLALPLQTDSS